MTRRRVLVVVAFVVVVVSLGLALLLTELVVLVGGGASMAPTIPAAKGEPPRRASHIASAILTAARSPSFMQAAN